MLQRRLIALCTGLLVFITIHAQVNLQTGSATFSMPMFSWKDDKSRLNIDVALSYSSGNGLKVNEVASNVGQGWNLFAGGVIVRVPVGEPDDQREFGNNNDEHDITKYPAGYLHTTRAPGDGCPLALTRYPIYGAKNERYKQHNAVAADKQLDYFSFQFNGKAGMFVLDPVKGNVCASLGETKLKITFDQADMTGQGIRTTISAFNIQDVDGLIYRFKEHGMTKVLESKFCDASLTQYQAQPNFKAGGIYHQAGFDNPDFRNPWVIGSWYLSEIEDPLTHRKITFTYERREINAVAGADISWDSWHDYIIITHKTSVAKTPVVTSATCPDGHKVTFKYEKERADLAGDRALTAVDVTYTATNKLNVAETRYLSRHQINTSYFILNRYGTPTSSFQKKMARLCLRSVKKIGPDLKEDSPPYTFDYYIGANALENYVPPPFCVSHDIWGFFNGFNSAGFSNNELILGTSNVSNLNFNQLKGLCFLRNGASGMVLNPGDGYAKNGLLKQIVYPTGGTLSYEYAQNTGVLDVDGNGPSTQVGGVHVSKTSATDGGYSNGCGNPITTLYNYVTSSGASSLWGLEMPDNSGEMSMYYAPEKKNYRWSLRKCKGGIYGCCYYAFTNPGIASQIQSVDLNGFQKFMVSAEPYMGILSAVMLVVDVIIVATAPTPLAIVALALDVISSWIQLGITCLKDNSKEGTTISYYNFDLKSVSPLPAQFKRVEVVEGTGSNGRTVHVFTSSDDYPVWAKTNPNFSTKQRFGPWLYGLPKFTTVLDPQGKKVRETENRYLADFSKIAIESLDAGAPTPNHGVRSSLVNCKCTIKKNRSQRYTDWVQPAKYNADYQLTDHGDDLAVEFYPMYTGKMLLINTYERAYKKGDDQQFVETVTGFTYGLNYDELQSITTTSSDGIAKTKGILYTKDLSGGIIDVMKQNNMLTTPVSTKEWTNGGYLNETVNEFTQTADGNIKIYRTLSERTDRPTWTWSHYTGPVTTDYSKFKVTQLLSFDASGNLVTAKDEGGRSVANIYDYNDKYVVASVINADAALDKPAYTSFETRSLGGWQLSASPTYIDNNAITGASVLNLAGNSCSAPLNTAKPYILSFWANNGNVTVTGGATLVNSAPVINGFTYYQYNIAAGTATVTLNGNALIDELRLYPKNARMRTVTYDPVIGKTSECDDNNRCTYYEYDNLARLKLIKDENRNIVKVYEYNNVSKQNGCPNTYYNQELTEYFTKDCTGDFTGSEEPYTVPANKYSSTISQEEADAQAQAEILAKGQENANTTGRCIPLYYNTEKWQDFESEGCADGYYGGNVRYTVPARRYFSKVPGEADQMALDDIAANGQAYANHPTNAVCILDTDPEWVMEDNAPTECRMVNGQPHRFGLAKDINPNSPSWNRTEYQDMGVDNSCPTIFYSDDVSNNYYPTNCLPGWTAYPTYVSMPAGSHTSSVSKQDANDKARAAAIDIANSRNWCVGPNIRVFFHPQGLGTVTCTMTNLVTGQRYNLIPVANTVVPSGIYDISFTNTSTAQYWYGTDCNGVVKTSAPYTMRNVLIKDDLCRIEVF